MIFFSIFIILPERCWMNHTNIYAAAHSLSKDVINFSSKQKYIFRRLYSVVGRASKKLTKKESKTKTFYSAN